MTAGIVTLLLAAIFIQPSDDPAFDTASPHAGGLRHAFEGPSIGSHFGHVAAPVGDVDADGWIDIGVGAPYADIARGVVTVYSGRHGDVLAEIRSPAEGSGRLGSALAPAGDVDGDGHADLAVGAPAQDVGELPGAGSVWIVSGADGRVLRSFHGASAGEGLGVALADAGDVDGDGIGDLALGTRRGNHVLLVSGADGRELQRLQGREPGDAFGIALAGVGDLDGDGAADLIVGADQGGRGPGYARVHSGRTGEVLFTFDGEVPGENLGGSVAAAGDVDGDGIGDLIVGTGTHDDTRMHGPLGHARVYSGADGSRLHDLPWRGAFVSGAGDVDGDGHADLALGTPFAGLDGSARGGLRVLSGRDASVLLALDGPRDGGRLGVSVDAGSDLDGDGRHELILGSDEFLTAAPSRGQVHVLDLSAMRARGPGSDAGAALESRAD